MNGRNIPSSGRLIEYQPPHSPFQKLIDSQRKSCGLSQRVLAEKIGVSHATLHIWLHNINGFPHSKSFNSSHARRLGEVLNIPERQIEAALDASRPFDAFGRFIETLENDKRQTVSKAYVLHLAKNLYRGAKVTLLVLSAIVSVNIAGADDLVTIAGKHYEEVRITEITPTTIAFMHATGAARLPLTDFGPDVQRKYGYEEAKAEAWLAEQARQAAEAAKAEQAREAQRKVDLHRANELRLEIENLARDGNAIDPATGRFYSSEAAQRQRAATFDWLQRHGEIHIVPSSANPR